MGFGHVYNLTALLSIIQTFLSFFFQIKKIAVWIYNQQQTNSNTIVFQTTLEELEIYFYVACGVTLLLFFFVFILIGILFVKVNRLVSDQ